jgi:nucleoside-diphosphate-sugar epimerase
MPLEPLPDGAHYARSKRESEAIALAAHRAGRAWVTAIRPCVVYGRHDRQFTPRIARVLRFGAAPIIGGGHAQMPIVHAANVADAAVRAATTDAAGGRAYNVANDFPVTVAEYMRLAGEGLGRRVRLIPLPMAVAVAGIAALRVLGRRHGNAVAMARSSVAFLTGGNPFTSERARRELGWTPTVRHEVGIPEAFAEHRARIVPDEAA